MAVLQQYALFSISFVLLTLGLFYLLKKTQPEGEWIVPLFMSLFISINLFMLPFYIKIFKKIARLFMRLLLFILSPFLIVFLMIYHALAFLLAHLKELFVLGVIIFFPILYFAPDKHHHPSLQTQTSHSQQQCDYYRVTAKGLNIHSKHQSSSKNVGTLLKDDKVCVIDTYGNWLHVQNRGWIYGKYTKKERH